MIRVSKRQPRIPAQSPPQFRSTCITKVNLASLTLFVLIQMSNGKNKQTESILSLFNNIIKINFLEYVVSCKNAQLTITKYYKYNWWKQWNVSHFTSHCVSVSHDIVGPLPLQTFRHRNCIWPVYPDAVRRHAFAVVFVYKMSRHTHHTQTVVRPYASIECDRVTTSRFWIDPRTNRTHDSVVVRARLWCDVSFCCCCWSLYHTSRTHRVFRRYANAYGHASMTAACTFYHTSYRRMVGRQCAYAREFSNYWPLYTCDCI